MDEKHSCLFYVRKLVAIFHSMRTTSKIYSSYVRGKCVIVTNLERTTVHKGKCVLVSAFGGTLCTKNALPPNVRRLRDITDRTLASQGQLHSLRDHKTTTIGEEQGTMDD